LVAAIIAAVGLGCAHPRARVGDTPSPLDGIGPVELVQDGFAFVEGMRWWPARGVLLVSDAYGEVIYELRPPGTLVPFRTGSNGANGLDVDSGGHLVAAEVGARRETEKGAVSRRRQDGTWADAIGDYRGLVLAHPNDVVALRDGTIFFSDLGLRHRLVRIDRQGALSHPLETGDERMNGLATSPDQAVLYVSGGGVVRSFELQDGSLGRQRATFITEPTPDGLCVDAAGNVFVGTRRGVQVWNPHTGQAWGLIALPGLAGTDRATDCEFAGADGRTLYISAVSKLFRVRLAGPGRPTAPAVKARPRALDIPVRSAIDLLPPDIEVVGLEID
jgi:gluconolactonase